MEQALALFDAQPAWAQAAIGLAVLALGCWHFFNMQMIARYGRKVGRWVRENHGAKIA